MHCYHDCLTRVQCIDDKSWHLVRAMHLHIQFLRHALLQISMQINFVVVRETIHFMNEHLQNKLLKG